MKRINISIKRPFSHRIYANNLTGNIKRITASSLLVLLVLASVSTHSPLLAQSVTEGYYSEDSSIQIGMLIGLKKDDPTKIESIDIDMGDRLHGVVVNGNEAPVTLSVPDQRVFVARTGRYEALVSDQNGTILPGDFLTPSNLSGIAMKADKTSKIILGKALQSFEVGRSTVVSTATLKDAAGGSRTVTLGRVAVDVAIGKNPFYEAPKQKNAVPEWLRKTTEAIAGKPVNPVKVYIALGIMLISALIAGTLLYSAVRSSMVSIGRNPLGKKTIMKSLIQVVIVGLIIFLTGIIGVYLLLRL